MRSDMFQVIIERPRHNHRGGYGPKGRLKEYSGHRVELSPSFEPVSMGRGNKHLNENLAPLRRFLRRHVGRPWNAVHAEICAELTLRSAVQKHVLDHLRDFVELAPVMIDGRPHRPAASGSRRDRYFPLRGGLWGTFYVCPKTRLLCAVSTTPRARPPDDSDRRKLGELREARRIDGIWYGITFARVPEEAAAIDDAYDVLIRARLGWSGVLGRSGRLWHEYGHAHLYAISKRQMSTPEIRALMLQAKR